MDKLAPKLIRRSLKKNYQAVIIDPIYKVLTGDENSADQMAHFTNQFDKVATELECSVIYCHHHSKGAQWGKKSMDRASGSGVFARDPDALIDLVELELTEDIIKQRTDQAIAKLYQSALQQHALDYYQQNVGLDDLESRYQMQQHFEKAIPDVLIRQPYNQQADQIEKQIKNITGWRVEGTLREFAKFKPVNMWFNYPKHEIDDTGVLADIQLIQLEDNSPAWKKNLNSKKANNRKKKLASERFETAMEILFDGTNPVELADIVEYFSTNDKPVSEKTIRRWAKNSDDFVVKNNQILPK